MSDQEACDGSDLEQRGDPNREFRTVAGRRILFDKEGFLWNLEDWSEEVAESLAGESGLNEMTRNTLACHTIPAGLLCQSGPGSSQRPTEIRIGNEPHGAGEPFPRGDQGWGAKDSRFAESQIMHGLGGMTERTIYLDNAATSFPKPASVLSAMVETYSRLGVSPGRGGYDLATEAEALVDQTREKLARFFGAPDPRGVIFANNATDALNLAIQGLLNFGDHVVSSRMEHNSVLRPLYHLRQRGYDRI